MARLLLLNIWPVGHPTWFMIDLSDLFSIVDIGCIEIFNISLFEMVVSWSGKSRECIYLNIFLSWYVRYIEIFKNWCICGSLLRYLAIVKSWPSYSLIAWLATSCESVNTHRLFIPSSLTIFSLLANGTLYLACLLVALNEKRSAYHSFQVVKINLNLFSWKFEAPFICKIQVIMGSNYLIDHLLYFLSDHIYSTIKSAKTWTFKNDHGW